MRSCDKQFFIAYLLLTTQTSRTTKMAIAGTGSWISVLNGIFSCVMSTCINPTNEKENEHSIFLIVHTLVCFAARVNHNNL